MWYKKGHLSLFLLEETEKKYRRCLRGLTQIKTGGILAFTKEVKEETGGPEVRLTFEQFMRRC